MKKEEVLIGLAVALFLAGYAGYKIVRYQNKANLNAEKTTSPVAPPIQEKEQPRSDNPAGVVDVSKAIFPPSIVRIEYESDDRSVKSSIVSGIGSDPLRPDTMHSINSGSPASQTAISSYEIRDDGVYLSSQKIIYGEKEEAPKTINEKEFPRFLKPGESVEIGGFKWFLREEPLEFKGWKLEPCLLGTRGEKDYRAYCHGLGLTDEMIGGVRSNLLHASAIKALSELEEKGLIPPSKYISEKTALASHSIEGKQIRLSLSPESDPRSFSGTTWVIKARSGNGNLWAVYFERQELQNLIPAMRNMICEGQHLNGRKDLNGVYSCFFVPIK